MFNFNARQQKQQHPGQPVNEQVIQESHPDVDLMSSLNLDKDRILVLGIYEERVVVFIYDKLTGDYSLVSQVKSNKIPSLTWHKEIQLSELGRIKESVKQSEELSLPQI